MDAVLALQFFTTRDLRSALSCCFVKATPRARWISHIRSVAESVTRCGLVRKPSAP
jgi:hypothetical protein